MVKQTILGTLVVLLLTGTSCKTTTSGGMPEPVYSIKKDMQAIKAKYGDDKALETFYNTPPPTTLTRNQFISARLALLNISYLEFVRACTADRQLLESATEMLVMGLNLAGTSAEGAAAKTTLAAIAAGVGGSKTIIDKNYYYNQDMPALIAAMNAQRKVVLQTILEGMMTKTYEEYPIETAVADLQAYYIAGTLQGARSAIQSDASAKEKEKDDEIKLIPVLSPTQIDLKSSLTKAVGKIDASSVTKGAEALAKLGVKAEGAELSQVRAQLQKQVRNARDAETIEKVHSVFAAAGLL